MLILGLDFETTGLDVNNDRVLEVGLCLYDFDIKRAVYQLDFFVQPDIQVGPDKWAQITPIHGITQELVNKYGMYDGKALATVNDMVLKADAVVAHNGTEYDKPLYNAWNRRYGREVKSLWIDTRLDVPEPMIGPLITQCAKRGFLNPFPHQALSDVNSMLRLLSEWDIEAVVAKANEPNVLVTALVTFDYNRLAKDRGYYAEYKLGKFQRWVKKMKLSDAEKERLEAPFKIMEEKIAV